ncbi:MAG: hypothetical protein IJV84_03535 [Bacteroidales bacterium]|nr:hypothetical protein [Bacteroidales bacterium]MBQ9722575.1 hypothetical protein [Bacteroidales bacterium]
MNRRQTIISTVQSAAAFLLAFAFFNFLYPYHIHYQEQMQLFRFGADYFRESVAVPGGLGDWIGGFLVQFFYHAPVGALILGILLVLIQMLTWKNMENGSFAKYPLSFLPAVAMFLFLCDENALVTAAIAIIASLTLAFILMKIRRAGIRSIITIMFMPVMYLLFGSISILVPVIVAIRSFMREEDKKNILIFSIAAVVMATAIPLVARAYSPYPLERLAFGVHYHRYHNAIPLLAWISVLMVPSAMLLATAFRKDRMVAASLALAILPAACLTPVFADMEKERLFGYDFMTRMGQWNKILATSDKDSPDSPIAVECTNLALAKTAHMSSDMFSFFQNGPAGLIPEFTRDHFSPVPTGTVYYHLGMINTAQTFFFEAQEGIPDFQKSARLTQALAKTNLINGDYEVARKYVGALKQTLFYREWAKETERLINNPELIEKVPEYAYLRSVRIKDHDFMFSQEEMDSMLGLMYVENEANVMAMDYLLAWCLLRKDLPRFFECHKLLKKGYDARHYQEAVVLYWALTHDGPEGMPGFITRNVASEFTRFISSFQSGRDEASMQKEFGDTYWFYYYYRFK